MLHCICLVGLVSCYGAKLFSHLEYHLKVRCYTKGKKEMFFLTTHSPLYIYGYMASNIW